MAFLEVSDFCSIEEYKSNLSNRADENQLRPDELFTLMLRLIDAKREAAKQPVKIQKVTEKGGIFAVRFAVLDDNLEPYAEVVQPMRDGVIDKFDNCKFIDSKTHVQYDMRDGYFRDYFQDQFGGFLQVSESCAVG